MQFHLETERLILRNIQTSDIDGMFELDSDPEVHKYLGNKPFTAKSQTENNIKEIIKQYENYGIGRWAMVNKQTNEFMGWSGLKFNTITVNGFTNFYDVGYRIIKRFWRKGYATESSIAALEYGFKRLDLDTIYGITDKDNQASHQILLKIGLNYVEDFYDENLNLNLRWYNILKP
jgi:ribosomal-protein-alanine N-acetyltransferase